MNKTNLPDIPGLSARDERFLRARFPNEDELMAAYERLKRREPLAYILGEWYFYNESYYVSPEVLVPQPDTELLVELVLKNAPQNAHICDLCTGSGCIGISALANRDDLTCEAVDISEKALEIAKRNALRNEISLKERFSNGEKHVGERISGPYSTHPETDTAQNGIRDAKSNNTGNTAPGRISFTCADLLSGGWTPQKTPDIIVSNPPYVRTDVIGILEPEVKAEPHIALDGGSDGLVFYRSFLKTLPLIMPKNGIILFEIGYDQAQQVCKLTPDGWKCRVFKDYSGNDRAVMFTRDIKPSKSTAINE